MCCALSLSCLQRAKTLENGPEMAASPASRSLTQAAFAFKAPAHTKASHDS